MTEPCKPGECTLDADSYCDVCMRYTLPSPVVFENNGHYITGSLAVALRPILDRIVRGADGD